MSAITGLVFANIYAIGAFIAGWVLGPRVITPLFQKLMAKLAEKVQSGK